MKVLILCNYTKGICGVFQRAKQEAIELEKLGHKVIIFSSNATKGSSEIASKFDTIGKDIIILRFPYKKLGGESFIRFNFEEEAIQYKPDIILAHSYRHLLTTKALKIGKIIDAKVYLITHAPFIENRKFPQNLIVWLYDLFIGRRTLNKFDKVIAITKWEIPYLLNLGLKKDKIVYIPNGIPDEFFKTKPKRGKGVFFLGRISPVKNLEVLIKACKNLGIKPIIIGPKEEGYKIDTEISPPIYDLKKKIKAIDKHNIFVLPSLRESMPQSLIEALARGKIVISSNTKGANEIIKNWENGFIFNTEQELTKLISLCLFEPTKYDLNRVRKKARKSVEKLKCSVLAKKLNSLFK